MSADLSHDGARKRTRVRARVDTGREFNMLIGGEWRGAQSGGTFSCVDPFTEEN